MNVLVSTNHMKNRTLGMGKTNDQFPEKIGFISISDNRRLPQ